MKNISTSIISTAVPTQMQLYHSSSRKPSALTFSLQQQQQKKRTDKQQLVDSSLQELYFVPFYTFSTTFRNFLFHPYYNV
jgi:hypothetical protein